MDQVRLFVGVIWRERFWVLTVIGTIVAVACWYLSSSDLDKQFASRKSAISGTFQSMQRLRSEPDHPNDDVIQGDKVQARLQRDNSREVWQKLYDEQKEEVLKWPADSLDPEFIEEIGKLRFCEKFPARKAQDMREEYTSYIGKRFDGLIEIVEALKEEGSRRGRGGARAGGPRFGEFEEGGMRSGRSGGVRSGRSNVEEEEQEDYLVRWEDQGNLQDKLDFAKKPNYLKIWITQEDLWVYETLLQAIADTNEEKKSTRPDNTAIRVIHTLEVGREAAKLSRQSTVFMPSSEVGGQRGMGSRGAFEGEGDFGGGYEPSGRGMGGEFGEESEEDVLAFRYLDAEGQPYPNEPEDPEFRRLPIYMNLTMDQRWLPRLLVECANATLPVEVNQVRINPEKSGGAASSGRINRSSRSRSRSSSRGSGEEREDPNLAEVEIHGIVYIYNQPDDAVLSLPGLDESEEEGDQLAEATGDTRL